jgi:serine/threonine-protein kinase
VLDGTYKIVRLVGAGGVGEVYEAGHTRLCGRYAVKVLLGEVSKCEDVLKRFQREAEVTSALRHPNIVQVVDFNRLGNGTPYLVMEYLEGVELAQEIQEKGPLDLARVLDLVGQLASALAAAHSQKIIHRDLKPQNLFLVRLPGDDREIVKILDFGISKVREAATKLTRQASIVGTPQYMAPEQARGLIDEIDERTDLFSLAAITYELLSGRPPFHGEAIEAILYQVVHEQPLPFTNPLPDIEAVVLRGLAKKKLDRYAGVREFHQALVKAAESTVLPALVARTLVAPEIPSVAKPNKPQGATAILPVTTTLSEAASSTSTEKTVETRSRRWPWLLIAPLLALGITSAFFWWTSERPPIPSEPAPVVHSAVPSLLDAGTAVAPLAVPHQREQVPPPVPATRKARSHSGEKKPPKIRMEDL